MTSTSHEWLDATSEDCPAISLWEIGGDVSCCPFGGFVERHELCSDAVFWVPRTLLNSVDCRLCTTGAVGNGLFGEAEFTLYFFDYFGPILHTSFLYHVSYIVNTVRHTTLTSR